jgi:hypothetical protein
VLRNRIRAFKLVLTATFRTFLNCLLALPFGGLLGTIYFGHTEAYSDCVARFGYDARRFTLDVHYSKNRALYRYHGVPFRVVFGFMWAKSKGRYLNQHILGKFRYQHLTWFPPKMQRTRLLKQLRKQGLERKRKGRRAAK